MAMFLPQDWLAPKSVHTWPPGTGLHWAAPSAVPPSASNEAAPPAKATEPANAPQPAKPKKEAKPTKGANTPTKAGNPTKKVGASKEAGSSEAVLADPAVLTRAAPPLPPSSLADYLKAHDLENVLNDALNVVAQRAPSDPWRLLARELPRDIAVPPPPTVPLDSADALRPELARLKHEWLSVHTLRA